MRSVGRAVLGVFTCLVLGVAALMVLVGVVVLIVGFVDAPRLERAHICRNGEHRNCLEAHEGRVLSVGRENQVRVQYDDGRRTRTLDLRGDAHPPVRAFVRVELWGDDAAAITDRQGRRYTDEIYWPVKWDPLALAVLGIGAAVLAVPIVVPRLRRLRRQ
jgi:hypothetical protein